MIYLNKNKQQYKNWSGDNLHFTLIIIIVISLLSGCNSQLLFSEISVDRANSELLSFINNVKDENGVYFIYGKKSKFVFLNGQNVKQGDLAAYFTNFEVESSGDTLNIKFNEGQTDDYSDATLKHAAIYKINLDKKYEYIKVFRNGEETPVSVLGN